MSSNLMKRLLSAALLIPPVLGLVWMGGWLFNGLIGCLLCIALYEWYGLTAPNLTGRGKFWAYGLPVLLLVIAIIKGLFYAFVIGLIAMPLLWYYVDRQHQKHKPVWKNRALWAALGTPAIVAGFFALIYLRSLEGQGLVFIAYLIAVVWGTDTGAYIAGKTIGGAKLLPKISPKKTWAGLFGGMVAAGLFGYLVAYGFGAGVSALYAGLLAPIFTVLAQTGDFIESYVKRQAKVKDSGALIPGHGGLLDRVDGLFLPALTLLFIALFAG